MNNLLHMLEIMIKEDGGAINYRNRGLRHEDLLNLLERISYLRSEGSENFDKADFDTYHLGMIRGMIECWLDDIRKYPPEGEFTVISGGHPISDLLALQELVQDK